jgi:Na+-transporting methylmalonyl-CoA/oxaloacetate decarboxylase gamma subunit
MVTLNRTAGDAENVLAAAEGAPAVIVFGLIVIGLLVLLIWVVWQVGARRRRDAPPTEEEQPRRPDHQTHFESRLEPDDDFDPSAGHEVPGRLTPHELHGYGNMGSRTAPEKKPPRDSDEGGGAFGSGGHGG